MSEPKFGKWIPTSERLPDRLTWVLATVKGTNKPRILCQNTEHGQTNWYSPDGMWEQRNVTAWMPLPKPYKEEEKKNG